MLLPPLPRQNYTGPMHTCTCMHACACMWMHTCAHACACAFPPMQSRLLQPAADMTGRMLRFIPTGMLFDTALHGVTAWRLRDTFVHKQCRMQGDCVIMTSRPPLLIIWDLQWILHFYITIYILHLKVPGPFHNMILGTRFLFYCVFYSASARLWKRLMLRFHLQSPAVAIALAGASGSGARFQVPHPPSLPHYSVA